MVWRQICCKPSPQVKLIPNPWRHMSIRIISFSKILHRIILDILACFLRSPSVRFVAVVEQFEVTIYYFRTSYYALFNLIQINQKDCNLLVSVWIACLWGQISTQRELLSSKSELYISLWTVSQMVRLLVCSSGHHLNQKPMVSHSCKHGS